jgi:hypothetical protein
MRMREAMRSTKVRISRKITRKGQVEPLVLQIVELIECSRVKYDNIHIEVVMTPAGK